MERRAFLRELAAAFAAAQTLPAIAAALSEHLDRLRTDLSAAPDEEAYWRRIGEEFLLEPGLLHFNCGSIGATPRAVVEAYKAYIDRMETNPYEYAWSGFPDATLASAAVAAGSFLGARHGSVLLTRNTTEGMNLVATGMRLQAGDEVLTTDHEHPGGVYCWLHMAEQQGVVVRQIHLPTPVTSKDDILQLVEDAITPRTRVCSFSHVTTTTGLQMPMREISALTRPRDILLVCDGAQAPGMLDVDVSDLGVDAYASSSHKWMLAPKGSGLLYVRGDAQDRIRPVSAFDTGQRNHSYYSAYTGATGTRGVPHLVAHADTMAFHNLIGRGRVETRVRQLNGYLRQRLRAIPMLTPLTPEDPELSSAMASYRLTGHSVAMLREELKRRHVIVKQTGYNWVLPGNSIPQEQQEVLRLSTHIFHDAAQIDGLVEAIGDILGVDTGVGMESPAAPRAFALRPNAPNPFNGATRIEYDLSRPGPVHVSVYDAQGHVVEVLDQGWRRAGTHRLTWSAGDRASGTYFCQVTAEGAQQVGKMLLLQ
ncbi:MAG: aminotransferase class V-fold PLP-dependent enzyme [Candidatus Latescibacterota bacterium]